MIKGLKKAIISMMLVACATSGAVGVATVAGASESAPVVVKDSDISMIQGASVRTIKNDNGGYGIRFTGSISKTVKENLEASYGEGNVEYGILICPKNYLTDGVVLDFDETDGLKRYDATNVESGVHYFESRSATELALNATSTAYEFRCSLVDIKTSNLDREFAAAAYVGVRESESEEFSYTVSSTFSRNIYTVATYALNDETIELDDGATKYLEEDVVQEVNKIYTETKVELSSTAPAAREKLFSVGETLTLNASVSTSDGKELEAGISLANAEGANLVKKSGNTYAVSSIGDIDLSVAFKGFDNANTDLSGYKCDTKAIAADTLFGEWSTGEHEFDLSTDITHPEGAKVYKYTPDKYTTTDGKEDDRNKGSLYFDKAEYSNWKNGTYIVMDIYNSEAAPSMRLNYLVKLTDQNGTYEGSDMYLTQNTAVLHNSAFNKDVAEYTVYNMDGTMSETAMKDNAFKGKWVRLQIKLLRDASDFGYRFGLIFNDHKESAYVANIQVRTYSEGYSAVDFADYDEEQVHVYGDTVSLSAQAITNRGLAKTVTAHCAVTEGNGTVVDDTFNVGLGDSKVKFSFAGFDQEVTVKGPKSMSVATDKVVLTHNKNDTVNLEKANSYTDANGKTENDVKKWYANTNSSQGNAFTFTEDVLAECTQGRYIYVKVLFTKQCTFYISSKESCYVYNNSYSYKQVDSTTGEHYLGEGLFELYDANGISCGEKTLWGSDNLLNQWLTIELKFSDSSWVNPIADWRFFSWINANVCTEESPAYIAGAEITLEPKDFSTAHIKTDGVTDIAKYAYTYNQDHMTFSEIKSSDIKEVSDKLAKSKVYAWAPAEGLENFDAGKGGITFGISRFMKKDMYLYFDFFVTENCTLTMYSGSENGKDTHYMYNSTSSTTDGVEWQFYDQEGNALSSGSIWNGNFKWQWITVEFKLVGDWDTNDCITRYTKAATNATFYLSNIRLSSTKLATTI